MDLAERQRCAEQKRADEARRLHAKFGALRLARNKNALGTFWCAASEVPEFEQLDKNVQRAYTALKSMQDNSNCVGYDCSTDCVAVFQHHFNYVSQVLPQTFTPLQVESTCGEDYRGAPLGELSDNDLCRVVDAMSNHYSELMAPNVVYMHPSATLTVGRTPTTDGFTVQAPCIRVIVLAKGKIPLGSWILPAEVDGVPVDVMEGYPLELLGKYDVKSMKVSRYDVDSMECNWQCPRLFTGAPLDILETATHFSFAGVVDTPRGQRGLACAHSLILHQKNSGRVSLRNDSGRTSWSIDRASSSWVDCGTFELPPTATSQLNPELEVSWQNLGFPGHLPKLTGTSDRVRHAQRVYKQGGKTGLTSGDATYGWAQFESPLFSCFDSLPTEQKQELFVPGRTYTLRTPCLLTLPHSAEAFALEGDSGSLVFATGEGTEASVVGMVNAGTVSHHIQRFTRENGRDELTTFATVACFIGDVEQALEAKLVF